jgi:hypothetical protein
MSYIERCNDFSFNFYNLWNHTYWTILVPRKIIYVQKQ